MTHWLVLLMLAAGLRAGPAAAVSDPGELLPNPALERRAEALGREFRCLVCQNESVEDSDADLARDLRRLIREGVTDGRSDADITAYLTSRYGDFVKLEPPFGWRTVALWGSPLLALGVGGALMARAGRPAAPETLTDAERARLAQLR